MTHRRPLGSTRSPQRGACDTPWFHRRTDAARVSDTTSAPPECPTSSEGGRLGQSRDKGMAGGRARAGPCRSGGGLGKEDGQDCELLRLGSTRKVGLQGGEGGRGARSCGGEHLAFERVYDYGTCSQKLLLCFDDRQPCVRFAQFAHPLNLAIRKTSSLTPP